VDDLPNFGLKRLSPADLLNKFDVPIDIVVLLGNGSGVGNFKADVYQDFSAGEDQYILSYRGTDLGSTSDWIANFKQGIGLSTAYYDTAMQIAFAISQLDAFDDNNVTIVGHSLGGGLASAAAVVIGFPAYTFNAAGMNSNTLNEQLYVGSTANYNNAASFIKAYYVDKDVLSAFQDNFSFNLPPVTYDPPSAIGQRIELVGPYHGVVYTVIDILTLGAADLGFAFGSHANNAVLYGLLAQNGNDALGVSTYYP
jgi:pimeloyl-ACP methyl ester carboxylesterase